MLPPTVKVYLAVRPLDLRKSFDGLSIATREIIGRDPLSGHLFVFLNRRRDRVKILAWDRNGFCLLYKRLERGTFSIPQMEEGVGQIEMEAADLAMMLDGVDLKKVQRGPRWQPGISCEKTSLGIDNSLKPGILMSS